MWWDFRKEVTGDGWYLEIGSLIIGTNLVQRQLLDKQKREAYERAEDSSRKYWSDFYRTCRRLKARGKWHLFPPLSTLINEKSEPMTYDELKNKFPDGKIACCCNQCKHNTDGDTSSCSDNGWFLMKEIEV